MEKLPKMKQLRVKENVKEIVRNSSYSERCICKNRKFCYGFAVFVVKHMRKRFGGPFLSKIKNWCYNGL